jgi:hypothetical protein
MLGACDGHDTGNMSLSNLFKKNVKYFQVFCKGSEWLTLQRNVRPSCHHLRSIKILRSLRPFSFCLQEANREKPFMKYEFCKNLPACCNFGWNLTAITDTLRDLHVFLSTGLTVYVISKLPCLSWLVCLPLLKVERKILAKARGLLHNAYIS